MKRLFIFIILFAGSVLAASAQETATRSLADFSEVTIGEAIRVILIPGNKNEAALKVRNIELEDVKTEVSGGRLKIGLRGTRYHNIEVEISLTYKSINAISVNSAAEAITKGAIKSATLAISVASAGSAELAINAEEIDVDVSSSGDLTLKGKTSSQRVTVSSAGSYQGYNLDCDNVYIRASSAGSANINANKKIDAKASSAGSVNYKGNPDKVYVNSSSGGAVEKSN